MQTSGQTASSGGVGLNTAEMKMSSTFISAGWSFNEIWQISSEINDGYPSLQWQTDNDFLFADFSVANTEIGFDAQIQFINQSLGTVGSYLWDFGDGVTSNQPSPTHMYAEPGNYTVSLTVSNSDTSYTTIKENYMTIIELYAAFSVSETEVDIGNEVQFINQSIYCSIN